jgi:hypothetical protein
MGFGIDQLRAKALAALEEAAEQAKAGPIERTKALRFAMAFLWTISRSDRTLFDWLWVSLAEPHDITRSQNVSAALNAVREASRAQPGNV